MTNPFHRLARLSTLALALVACSFTPGGMLLCVGFDGHIAVELTRGACTPAPGAQADDHPAVSRDHGSGPCLDVTVERPVPTRAGSVDVHDHSLDPVALPARVVARSGIAAARLLRPGALPAACAPGAARRSILRC